MNQATIFQLRQTSLKVKRLCTETGLLLLREVVVQHWDNVGRFHWNGENMREQHVSILWVNLQFHRRSIAALTQEIQKIEDTSFRSVTHRNPHFGCNGMKDTFNTYSSPSITLLAYRVVRRT